MYYGFSKLMKYLSFQKGILANEALGGQKKSYFEGLDYPLYLKKDFPVANESPEINSNEKTCMDFLFDDVLPSKSKLPFARSVCLRF